jgi:hypothetical protein
MAAKLVIPKGARLGVKAATSLWQRNMERRPRRMVDPHNCTHTSAPIPSKMYASLAFPVTCHECGSRVGVRGMFAGLFATCIEFEVLLLVLLVNGLALSVLGVAGLLGLCAVNVLLGFMQPYSVVTQTEHKCAVWLLVLGALLVIAVWAFRAHV